MKHPCGTCHRTKKTFSLLPCGHWCDAKCIDAKNPALGSTLNPVCPQCGARVLSQREEGVVSLLASKKKGGEKAIEKFRKIRGEGNRQGKTLIDVQTFFPLLVRIRHLFDVVPLVRYLVLENLYAVENLKASNPDVQVYEWLAKIPNIGPLNLVYAGHAGAANKPSAFRVEEAAN